MEQLQLFFELGLTHVLDINGYDHILFLAALAAPYVFSNWKKILFLVTIFTIGHTISLVLSSYNIVKINSDLVEFLIPVTIAITALYNIFFSAKPIKDTKVGVVFFITLFFGIIHGLGFSNYFKMIIGSESNKFLPLIEFALGVEVAQVIIVLVVLLLGSLVQNVLNVSKRIWVVTLSSIIIGLVIPMLLTR
ncbi:MAG: HupE/UreJ family protein [Flavobacteriaceae bacterium]